MNVKNLTLGLFCAVFYHLPLPGQDYYFPTQNAVWEESGFSLVGSFIKYHALCGDTVILDQTYQKVYYTDYLFASDTLVLQNEVMYVGALRVAGSQVFFVDNFGAPEEFLLYDFGLEEEESVNLPSPTVGQDNVYQVSSVDSVMIEGSVRRRITLESETDQSTDVWIEGIGSITYGLLDRGLGLIFDYSSSLRCFRDDNVELTYTVSGKEPCIFVIADVCAQVPTGTRKFGIPDFKLYPNPTGGPLHIELPLAAADGLSVVVHDVFGRRRLSLSFGDGEVDLSPLPAGLYTLSIWSYARPVSVGKRIVRID